MKIGEDYEKIEFEAFGLDLLEPNAFIGDMLIAGLAFYALWIFRNTPKDAFFTNWRRFFFVFGMSFVAGALGHLMFNYWGIPGKYASWYLGIFSPYFIEQAMMSVHPEQKTGKLLLKLSNAKLLLALIAETLMLALTDVEATPTNGLHVVTATTSIGLIFSLGYLGVKYEKAIGRPFKNTMYFRCSPTGCVYPR